MVLNEKIRYTEVLYFFVVHKADLRHTLAAVKLFAPPNPDLLRDSFETLWVCKFPGDEGIAVVDAKCITDVIGMIPFHQPGEEGDTTAEEFFAVEKITLMQFQTAIDENDNDDEQDGPVDT